MPYFRRSFIVTLGKRKSSSALGSPTVRLRKSQQLLGMIINTVALRISFSGYPSFREILSRMREAILQALDNQDAPFDRLVQRLGPGAVPFNTFFDTYDRPYPSYRNDHLRVERKDVVNNGSCKFDIVALVIPGSEAVFLLWEYNTDLFDEGTASQMMRHFLALLEASIFDPALPTTLLSMLSTSEAKSIVATCEGKSASYSRGHRLDEIFAAVASDNADADAVVCKNQRLSYRELDQRAAGLADQLRAQGARTGEVVAFSLPRGVEAVCAMLAILKCGGIYLPVDPKLPKLRQEALLQIAGSMLQITEHGIVQRHLRKPFNPAQVRYRNPPPILCSPLVRRDRRKPSVCRIGL